MTLTTHHLEFTAHAATPLALDDQAGASIRGALVGALWGQFCANKAAPTCAACPLLRACPVAALIAPMRDAGESGGDQRPRPYVIRPPEGRRYAPGETLSFGLGLFGHAAHLFPYLVMAAQGIEQSGLGRRLPENRGQRGRPQIVAIDAVNPLSGARQRLYQRGSRQVQSPGLPITPDDVAAFATALPTDRLALHFRTPLRLIDAGRLVRSFAPRPFFQRLKERVDDLAQAYADAPRSRDVRPLLAQVAAVSVVADQTRWIDVVSYSSRTNQRTQIGGLIGAVTLAGDLAPLRELLAWGSLVHVGKNAVKGDGWYQIAVV